MTISPKSTALTDEQIIERLAKYLELHLYCACCNTILIHQSRCEECDCVGLYCLENPPHQEFHPESDENHFRVVLERVMRNEKLYSRLVAILVEEWDGSFIEIDNVKKILKTPLPERCKALISALDSLPTHKND